MHGILCCPTYGMSCLLAYPLASFLVHMLMLVVLTASVRYLLYVALNSVLNDFHVDRSSRAV
jgi:hypothetical protein